MKTINQNSSLAAIYYLMGFFWVISLLVVSYIDVALDSICGSFLVFIAMINTLFLLLSFFNRGRALDKTYFFGSLFTNAVVILYFVLMRHLIVRMYNKAHSFEEAIGIRLLSSDAPEFLGAYSFYTKSAYPFLFFGFGFCLATLAYFWHSVEFETQPRDSMFTIRVVSKIYFVSRILAVLPICLIIFISFSYNYRGALTDWLSIIVMVAVLLDDGSFWNELFRSEKRKIKHLGLKVFFVICFILFFLVLRFVIVKNQEILYFSWGSEFVIDDERLALFQNLSPDLKDWLVDLKKYSVFPVFRGDYLSFVAPEVAPDPFSWKDFILVIPVSLYFLFFVCFFKPWSDHERKEIANESETVI